SGVVPPAMEVTNRSCASPHSTNWTSSVAPVSSSNAVATSSKNASASGFVPCMIQTLRLSALPPPPSPPVPHAATAPAGATAPVVTATDRRIVRFIVRLPFARCRESSQRVFLRNELPNTRHCVEITDAVQYLLGVLPNRDCPS